MIPRKFCDIGVAQVSKPAVSPTSQSAGCARESGVGVFERNAGGETRDTADLEVCATRSRNSLARVFGRAVHADEELAGTEGHPHERDLERLDSSENLDGNTQIGLHNLMIKAALEKINHARGHARPRASGAAQ